MIVFNFSVKQVILVGEKAGATVACQFALNSPNLCMGMILIDLDTQPSHTRILKHVCLPFFAVIFYRICW